MGIAVLDNRHTARASVAAIVLPAAVSQLWFVTLPPSACCVVGPSVCVAVTVMFLSAFRRETAYTAGMMESTLTTTTVRISCSRRPTPVRRIWRGLRGVVSLI